MTNPSVSQTRATLLSRLRHHSDMPKWESSWHTFFQLYFPFLKTAAMKIYGKHTNGAIPPLQAIEDIVMNVIRNFYVENRYDPQKGRLRVYLRMLVNARVVDLLRKERPLNHLSLTRDDSSIKDLPDETSAEGESFNSALLSTLVEDLRDSVPHRHFEIFERVKLRHESPEEVASDLNVKRGVIDNTIYKCLVRLREIAATPEYQEEYYSKFEN